MRRSHFRLKSSRCKLDDIKTNWNIPFSYSWTSCRSVSLTFGKCQQVSPSRFLKGRDGLCSSWSSCIAHLFSTYRSSSCRVWTLSWEHLGRCLSRTNWSLALININNDIPTSLYRIETCTKFMKLLFR